MTDASLLPLFEWFDATALGVAIRNSLWLFPVIEALHLVAFAVLGGTVLLVDLRLLGLLFRGQPVNRVASETRRWHFLSLGAALLTGSLLFVSEPLKLYYNDPFWIKITCLPLAMLFTYVVRDRVTRADEEAMGWLWPKLAGAVSLALWSGVAWGGRWIGFWG